MHQISHKSTKSEYKKRINIITSLLVKGLRRDQICQYITQNYNEWGVSVRQIDRYIAKSTELLKDDTLSLEIQQRMQITVARLEIGIDGAMRDRDWRGTAKLMKELDRLLNLKKAFQRLNCLN